MNQANRLYIHLSNAMREARDERGATGVEYGIMVAAIAAVIVAVAFAIGVKVDTAFETVNTNLTVPAAN